MSADPRNVKLTLSGSSRIELAVDGVDLSSYIVEGFLSFSRSETPTLTLQLEPLDGVEVSAEIADIVRQIEPAEIDTDVAHKAQKA